MKDVFLVVGALLTIGGVVPYLRDIIKGVTRPNLVSWITWTLLTGIATAAEIAAHEYTTTLFTSASVTATAAVVVVGLYKRAYVRYEPFDIICQIGAIVGILLWQLFDSPAIGVIASMVIDFIGALPTFRHSFKEPYEETWQTYALSCIGGIFGLLALEAYNLISLPYVLYIVLVNAAFAIVILRGRKAAIDRASKPRLTNQ